MRRPDDSISEPAARFRVRQAEPRQRDLPGTARKTGRMTQLALDNARERHAFFGAGIGRRRYPRADLRSHSRYPGGQDRAGRRKAPMALPGANRCRKGQILLTIADLSPDVRGHLGGRSSYFEVSGRPAAPDYGRRISRSCLGRRGKPCLLGSARSPDRNALPAFEVVGLLNELDAAAARPAAPRACRSISTFWPIDNPAALMVPPRSRLAAARRAVAQREGQGVSPDSGSGGGNGRDHRRRGGNPERYQRECRDRAARTLGR